MSMTAGILMDPIQSINIKKDSSFAMLLAAQQRGYTLFYMEQADLFLRNGKAFARMAPIRVQRDPNHWFELGDYQEQPLSTLHMLLMRKDPPFDLAFLHTTLLLERAEADGVLVVNRPQSLRDANEKLFISGFSQCCVPTLVSRNKQQLRQFVHEQQDVIFKPLDGMGGSAIFRVTPTDANLSVILETLTRHEQEWIMAQRFIPEIRQGDKRILMIDGEPIDYALARIPAQGETRGNLAAGGSGVVQPLTERDRWIAAQVGPTLKAKGLYFVGLDVIGDYLTEINVTSPTCIQEIENATGISITGQLFDALERHC